jgi:hypothetical protein
MDLKQKNDVESTANFIMAVENTWFYMVGITGRSFLIITNNDYMYGVRILTTPTTLKLKNRNN